MISFGVGVCPKRFSRAIVVKVAECDDSFVPAASQIVLAYSRYTYGGNSEGIAGRLIAQTSKDMARDDKGHCKGSCKKASPGKSAGRAVFFVRGIVTFFWRCLFGCIKISHDRSF
jgi:hypothetical protein